MKRVSKMAIVVLAALMCVSAAQADMLAGVSTITAAGGELTSVTYDGVTYDVADLGLGATTRWYLDNGTETLWEDGGPLPPGNGIGTTPKAGDVGSKADNFIFNIGSANDISSLDGIDFQQTIFPFLTTTIFVFERGGNDNGTVQAILPGGTLGDLLTLTANGAPYANTGVSVNGSSAFGYALETSVPVIGLRISAPGHDSLSVSAVPEPTSMMLLAMGGLMLLRRRR